MLIVMLAAIALCGWIYTIRYIRKNPIVPIDRNEHGLPFKIKQWNGKYYNIGFWDKSRKKVIWLLDIFTTSNYSKYLEEHEPTTGKYILKEDMITTVANQFKTIQVVHDHNSEVKSRQAKQYVDYWVRHWEAEKNHKRFKS